MKFSWKEMNWLLVAAGITAGYVIGIAFILGSSKVWTFLSTTEELNSVGDFIAGVFAPVALIWLVAAVLTQRQELNETRDQFEENQKVVDAQLKTINSQNELLTLQHKQAVENAAKAYRLSLFDKRYQFYEKFIAFGETHNGSNLDDDSYLAITNLIQEAGFIFDSEFESWLEEIGEEIFNFVQFKGMHPLRMIDDGMGNSKPADDEHNANLKREYNSFTSWIDEQFFPHDRTAKFYRFMNVNEISDPS